MADLCRYDVTTVGGKRFTGEESAILAALIFRRFGEDIPSATAAWRRLLQNSTPETDFEGLVKAGLNLLAASG